MVGACRRTDRNPVRHQHHQQDRSPTPEISRCAGEIYHHPQRQHVGYTSNPKPREQIGATNHPRYSTGSGKHQDPRHRGPTTVDAWTLRRTWERDSRSVGQRSGYTGPNAPIFPLAIAREGPHQEGHLRPMGTGMERIPEWQPSPQDRQHTAGQIHKTALWKLTSEPSVSHDAAADRTLLVINIRQDVSFS